MKIKINKENIYLSTFILWYAMSIINGTTLKTILGADVSTITNIVEKIVILLFCIVILMQKYRTKELLLIFSISILVLISCYISGNYILMSGWLFIVAAKNTSIEKIVSAAYYVLILLILIVLVLYCFGAIKDCSMFRGNKVRYSLGFSHPNILGLRILQLNLYHYFLNREKYIYNLIIGILSAFFVFFVPNSQTSFACITILIVFIVFEKRYECFSVRSKNITSNILLFFTIIVNLLSVILTLLIPYKLQFVREIEHFLSYRFTNCYKVMRIYGISLFGNKMYISGASGQLRNESIGRLFLDNAYVGIMLWYGILIYLLFWIAYTYTIYMYSKEYNYIMTVVLLVFVIYGFMEQGTYIISHNIFIIALSRILYLRDSNSYSHNNRFKISQKNAIISIRI